MSFIYGVIGTLAVLVLFIGGAFAGYGIRGKIDKLRRPVAPSAEEKELERLKAQQKAFDYLQSYSPEMAYGMYDCPFGEGVDEDGGDKG